jgi:hypothetical protein
MQILSQKKALNGKLQIVLEISSDEAESFLEKEENLAKLLNEVVLPSNQCNRFKVEI